MLQGIGLPYDTNSLLLTHLWDAHRFFAKLSTGMLSARLQVAQSTEHTFWSGFLGFACHFCSHDLLYLMACSRVSVQGFKLQGISTAIACQKVYTWCQTPVCHFQFRLPRPQGTWQIMAGKHLAHARCRCNSCIPSTKSTLANRVALDWACCSGIKFKLASII